MRQKSRQDSGTGDRFTETVTITGARQIEGRFVADCFWVHVGLSGVRDDKCGCLENGLYPFPSLSESGGAGRGYSTILPSPFIMRVASGRPRSGFESSYCKILKS